MDAGGELTPVTPLKTGRTDRNFANRPTLATSLLVASCSLLGCSASAPDDDALTSAEALRNGAAEADLREGSAEAKAIVALANDRTLTVIAYEDEVGLRSSTAESLVNVRNGVDLTAGTDDDESFETLAELDALPRTNAAAFKKMLAYAEAHRDKYFPASISPLNDQSCSGAPISPEKLQTLFAAGRTIVNLPTTKVWTFKRTINGLGSATDWVEQPPLSRRYSSHSNGGGIIADYTATFDVVVPVLAVDGGGKFSASFANPSAVNVVSPDGVVNGFGGTGFVVPACPFLNGAIQCNRNLLYTGNYDGGYSEFWVDGRWRFEGTISDSCLRIRATDVVRTPVETVETTLVIVGSF